MSTTNLLIDSSSYVRSTTRPTQLLSPDMTSSCALRFTSSAPQSRAGSFKKTRRRDQQDESRSSLPSLEDSILAKLEELKQLEEDNCCAVRQFKTSSVGIVNHGDSFRRRKTKLHGGLSHVGTAPHAAAANGESSSRVQESCGPQRQASVDRTLQVLIMGDHSVGKTALLQQFMTSEYMAAMNTSFDIDGDKMLSVMLDDEETLINFVDIETSSHQDNESAYPDVHCYILLYSITDRKSFTYLIDLLTDIRQRSQQGNVVRPIIVVGNKNDLVRKRQVNDREVKELCTKHGLKFISVSAVLNHRIDELLVGIVSQLRLYYSQQSLSHVTDKRQTTACNDTCMTSPRGLLSRLLFTRHKETRLPCEDLMAL